MSDQKPILCPVCSDSINAHIWEDDYETFMCGGAHGDCDCHLSPSDVARSLLAAEPTDEEVERAAREIHGFHGINDWSRLTDASRDKWRTKARVALRAARGLA